jgi:hypothetical protein
MKTETKILVTSDGLYACEVPVEPTLKDVVLREQSLACLMRQYKKDLSEATKVENCVRFKDQEQVADLLNDLGSLHDVPAGYRVEIKIDGCRRKNCDFSGECQAEWEGKICDGKEVAILKKPEPVADSVSVNQNMTDKIYVDLNGILFYRSYGCDDIKFKDQDAAYDLIFLLKKEPFVDTVIDITPEFNSLIKIESCSDLCSSECRDLERCGNSVAVITTLQNNQESYSVSAEDVFMKHYEKNAGEFRSLDLRWKNPILEAMEEYATLRINQLKRCPRQD